MTGMEDKKKGANQNSTNPSSTAANLGIDESLATQLRGNEILQTLADKLGVSLSIGNRHFNDSLLISLQKIERAHSILKIDASTFPESIAELDICLRGHCYIFAFTLAKDEDPLVGPMCIETPPQVIEASLQQLHKKLSELGAGDACGKLCLVSDAYLTFFAVHQGTMVSFEL